MGLTLCGPRLAISEQSTLEQEEEPNSGDDLHLILIPSFTSDLMYFKVYHFIFPDVFRVE